MSCNFFLFFKFFYPKSIFKKKFRWGIILMDFVGFPFRISKLKNDISYINISFHIDLGRFVGIEHLLFKY